MQPVDGSGERPWPHRKGAAPSDRSPVVIPGSRGILSYLVQPIGGPASSLDSLAHGAGRKWKRGEARARLSARQRPEVWQQRSAQQARVAEDQRWRQHTQLERGNAVRVFRGLDWKN